MHSTAYHNIQISRQLIESFKFKKTKFRMKNRYVEKVIDPSGIEPECSIGLPDKREYVC